MVLVVVVALILVLIAFAACRGGVVDGPGMVNPNAISKIDYYHGGSDIGDSYRISFEDQKLTFEKCEGNGMETITKTVDVDTDFYNEVVDWAISNNIRSWTNLKKSDLEELDAPTTSLSVEYEDGTEIWVNSDDILPDEGWSAVKSLVKLFESQQS